MEFLASLFTLLAVFFSHQSLPVPGVVVCVSVIYLSPSVCRTAPPWPRRSRRRCSSAGGWKQPAGVTRAGPLSVPHTTAGSLADGERFPPSRCRSDSRGPVWKAARSRSRTWRIVGLRGASPLRCGRW